MPDFFTEWFEPSGNDLANLSVTLTPAANISGYTACIDPIANLPTDPTGGTNLSLGDDDYISVSVGGGNTVALYGVSYGSFYACSNGYLTFQAGDTDYTETLTDHFDAPRVSGLFDDLNPNSGGTISYRRLADRIAVTYLNVPEYSATGANTFQFELYYDRPHRDQLSECHRRRRTRGHFRGRWRRPRLRPHRPIGHVVLRYRTAGRPELRRSGEQRRHRSLRPSP